MLHALGHPTRPVVTGGRWGRGSEPYGLCVRTAHADAYASLPGSDEGHGNSEEERRTERAGVPPSSPGSGLRTGAPPSSFTFDHLAGCAGNLDARASVHAPSSPTPSPGTLLSALQGPPPPPRWGPGGGGAGGGRLGGPSLAARRPCMSSAPASSQPAVPSGSRRTREAGHVLLPGAKGREEGLERSKAPQPGVPEWAS